MSQSNVRILFVHTFPLDHLGGAELSLRHHVQHAPAQVAVDVIQPHQSADLATFDAIVLGNLRPPGGVGENGECEFADLWLRNLGSYDGFIHHIEYDAQPCGHRDARCVECPLIRKRDCDCSPRIPAAFERLFNRCDAVQFVSPEHQRVINAIIRISCEQVVIANPIDLTPFQNRVPWHERRAEALIVGDAIRVANTAEELAMAHGYRPARFPYLTVPYSKMPDLLNEYQAVVVDPVMYHSNPRIVVEAMACGCKVLTGPRVGTMSWDDPIKAALEANDRFWSFLLSRIPRRPT